MEAIKLLKKHISTNHRRGEALDPCTVVKVVNQGPSLVPVTLNTGEMTYWVYIQLSR